MHFTREPIIETVITPKEGSKLLIRNSKGGGKEDYFVDLDTDGDRVGNTKDLDDDNDGLLDEEELKIGTNPLLVDTDGDGVEDSKDVFPLDPKESKDNDGDGIGNNADLDDDNDGVPDSKEEQLGTDPFNPEKNHFCLY